ncbi:DUF2213 domain-containing protein [Candidatus Pacearchaeota archaeon]|nr:DUF2213 domain-containing protein [Candidatus Pacearchaeota archaeon]
MRTNFKINKKKEAKQELTLNKLRHLMASFVREDTLDGKEYYVIPSIAITEGVHNNILYPSEELAKSPEAWNGIPVTNGHPNIEGTSCSANKPEIVTNFQIGTWYNCEYVAPKLKGEIWLDKVKCNELNDEIIANLLQNTPTDVSTGLYTDDDIVEGEFGGIKYNYIAKNYRPDHLAILPNDIGACSWEDGAGMARTNKATKKKDEIKSSKEIKTNFLLKVNELSHNKIYSALNNLIREPFSNDKIYTWISDIYDKYCIYEIDESGEGIKFYKQSYSIDASDVVSLTGDPIEVIKEVIYTPKITTNQSHKEIVMEREERVQKLVVNKLTKWEENDKDFLTGLDDGQFDKIEASVPVEEEVKTNSEDDAKGKPEVKKEEKKVDKKPEVKVNSVDDFIKSAPAEMQGVLTSSLKNHNDAKAVIVEKLKANKACKFSDEQLNAKSLEELQILDELSFNGSADYKGGGGSPEVKTNSDDNAAPEMAETDWSKE